MPRVMAPMTSTITAWRVPGGQSAAKTIAMREEAAVPMFCPIAMPVTLVEAGNCSGKKAGKTAL